MANVPLKFLLKMSDNIVCGDDNAKKGTQLSLIEESYINKESEKQLRSRYDQFISSKDVADFAIICNAVVLWFSLPAATYAARDFDPGLIFWS